MKKLIINQKLTGSISEGFHEMNSSELIKFYGSDANRCGMYDEERHMAVIVSWHKSKILAFLTDERSAIRGIEARYKRNLRYYSHKDTLSRMIADHQAVGIRFEYKPDDSDIIQYGDLYTFKHDRVYYFIQIVGRKAGFEEDRCASEEFLGSIKAL